MAAQDPVIAIDTIVVVRFLVNDDREQARRARALIDGEDVFVATTVLLETESVLRSAYQLSRQELFDALRAFLDLPRVSAQDREGAGRRSTGPNKAWTSPTRSILPAPPAASPSRASIASLSKRRRNWERLRSGRREARIGARARI